MMAHYQFQFQRDSLNLPPTYEQILSKERKKLQVSKIQIPNNSIFKSSFALLRFSNPLNHKEKTKSNNE